MSPKAPRESSVVQTIAATLRAERWNVTRVQVAGQGTAGVPDLHVSAPYSNCDTTPWRAGPRGWVEVKAGRNKLSALQRAWIKNANARGDRALVVRRASITGPLEIEDADGRLVESLDSYADLPFALRQLLS